MKIAYSGIRSSCTLSPSKICDLLIISSLCLFSRPQIWLYIIYLFIDWSSNLFCSNWVEHWHVQMSVLLLYLLGGATLMAANAVCDSQVEGIWLLFPWISDAQTALWYVYVLWLHWCFHWQTTVMHWLQLYTESTKRLVNIYNLLCNKVRGLHKS